MAYGPNQQSQSSAYKADQGMVKKALTSHLTHYSLFIGHFGGDFTGQMTQPTVSQH